MHINLLKDMLYVMMTVGFFSILCSGAGFTGVEDAAAEMDKMTVSNTTTENNTAVQAGSEPCVPATVCAEHEMVDLIPNHFSVHTDVTSEQSKNGRLQL